jgi:hypothetical protein
MKNLPGMFSAPPVTRLISPNQFCKAMAKLLQHSLSAAEIPNLKRGNE